MNGNNTQLGASSHLTRILKDWEDGWLDGPRGQFPSYSTFILCVLKPNGVVVHARRTLYELVKGRSMLFSDEIVSFHGSIYNVRKIPRNRAYYDGVWGALLRAILFHIAYTYFSQAQVKR
jgi:hypothetical protein